MDASQALPAVQHSLYASIARAPWRDPLRAVVGDLLASSDRVLGGRLTKWALIPLCSCVAACGDWRPALPAAAAVEMYSVVTDVFDDVEDNDLSLAIERHGMPIVLNAAMALLVHANDCLAAAPEPFPGANRRAQDALRDGLLIAASGQHLDLASAGHDPLSVEDCLEIARGKAGALVAAACVAGASFGTPDETLLEGFHMLGMSLGLVGQLDNDMHDADNCTRKTDVSRLKQTVPIAFARRFSTSSDLEQAVWQAGIPMTYALLHAERVRAAEALDAVAALCPDPVLARSALAPMLYTSPAVASPAIAASAS
jgi:geranylgeranyl pyrophosphate synthase